jgi:hypothetical protein
VAPQQILGVSVLHSNLCQLAGVDVLEASFLGKFSEGGGFNTNIGGIHFTDRPAQLAGALASETDPPCP